MKGCGENKRNILKTIRKWKRSGFDNGREDAPMGPVLEGMVDDNRGRRTRHYQLLDDIKVDRRYEKTNRAVKEEKYGYVPQIACK